MNGKYLVFLLVLAVSSHVATATYGIDMSMAQCESGVSSSAWSCLIQNGYTFAIIETFDGGYQYNDNIATCVANAWAAGMAHVDVYVFMCPNCYGNNPPSTAVANIVNNLRSQGVNFGMLWFDIEQCDGCWNDYSSNVQFVQEAVNQAVAMGVSVGMYSSEYEWSVTMGDDTSFSEYPLWYAHYDDDPAFDDSWAWEFGGKEGNGCCMLIRTIGWTYPAIKQYWDSGPCTSVDVDWYPDSFAANGTHPFADRIKKN